MPGRPLSARCLADLGRESSISCTWRISMISLPSAGQRFAHAMASSFEFTRIIQ